jgi:RNA polymerase sigma-70 factor, ECF subfamily
MIERDKLLFERIKNSDDQKAFEFLYHLYYSPLCSYAMGFVKIQSEAQDLVNDCFYELWKSRSSMDLQSSLKAWLYICVRNRAINHLKKTKAVNRYLSALSYPFAFEEEIIAKTEELLMQEELTTKLRQAIEQLPGQCRYIFYLNRFEGMKYKEIARKLNLSEATIKTQIARALKSLRGNLENVRSTILLFLRIRNL